MPCGLLALDELALEQVDQVVATARLHPVLAQFDHGLGGHGESPSLVATGI
jgi:hypothetical protein